MVSEGQNMTLIPTGDPSAPCWTDGCEETRAHPEGRTTYWCEVHDAERRERITRGMADLASAGASLGEVARSTVEKIATFANDTRGAYQCAGINNNGTQCRRQGWSPEGFLCHQHS